ncbi:MAG: hypothetical protein ACHRXM_15065 [Isosphaerales bacterium]
MRAIIFSVVFCTWATSGFGQESFKVSVLKEPPPGSVAADVRGAMNGQGFRIQDDQGRTLADIWLRKAIPSTDEPAGPKGDVQFPFLAEGELLGLLQFATEGHDYRDQRIAKGAYTMRYGLQPINGDHLGVSTYRDYSLLLPASKDRSLALPPRKQLEQRSADSAGTSHPAVFLLLTAPPDAPKPAASMIHDAEMNTWSVILPLNLQCNGKGEPIIYPVRLVVVGVAAA